MDRIDTIHDSLLLTRYFLLPPPPKVRQLLSMI